MELANPWLLAVWLCAGVGVAVAAVAVSRRRGQARRAAPDAVRAANLERLRALPSFARLVRRYRLLVALVLLASIAGLVAAGTLSARVVRETTTQPERNNRDIMLCLDISGSMAESVVELLDTFTELAEEFRGERIGLTVFNSSSLTLFPLTDDYDFVKEQLEATSEQLTAPGFSKAGGLLAGTLIGEGSSLIGDGLASCVLRFDKAESKRPRSIILATDNEVSGSQLVDLDGAVALAQERDVRIFAINPADTGTGFGRDTSDELRAAVEGAGGVYFPLKAPDEVPRIVEEVQEQEAAALRSAPRTIEHDEPAWAFAAALLAVGGVVVAGWRGRL